MRDVERSHDRDALEADYFASVANLEHFFVQVVDGFEQPAFAWQ